MMTLRRTRRRPARLRAALVTSTVATATMASAAMVGVGAAGPATAAATTAVTGTVSTNAISFPTVDGDILSMRTFVRPHGTHVLLAIGGDFQHVRTTAGVEHSATNLAVIDARTGKFVKGFDTGSTGYVRAIALNTSHSVLYVGGSFSKVGSTKRARVAALSTKTWKVTSFHHGVTKRVEALAATSKTLYVGGSNSRVYAISASTRALRWSDPVSCGVRALQLTANHKGLFVGGLFDKLNTTSQHGLVKVWSHTGVVLPGFKVTYLQKDSGGCTSGESGYDGENPLSMTLDRTTNRLIVGAGGIENGFRAVDTITGHSYWSDAPAGDGQAVAAVGNTDIVGHHQSGLHLPSGWTSGPKFIGQVTNDGQHLTSWDPKLAGFGTNQDDGNDGVQAMVYDSHSQRLFVGGSFLTQNGVSRKGLAAFTVS